MRHGLKALVASVLLSAAGAVQATSIIYDFVVVSHSASAAGYFSYDDSIASRPAGFFNPSRFFTDFQFTWGGIAYDTTNVYATYPGFNQDGTLNFMHFGTHCGSTGCSITGLRVGWDAFQSDWQDSSFRFSSGLGGIGGASFVARLRTTSVPEPGTFALLGLGLAGLGLSRRRMAN